MRKNKGVFTAAALVAVLLLTAVLTTAAAASIPGYSAYSGYTFNVSAGYGSSVVLRQTAKGNLTQQSKWDSSSRVKQSYAMYHVTVNNRYDGDQTYEWTDEQITLSFTRNVSYTITVTPYTMEEMDTALNSYPTTDFLYNCAGWSSYPTWRLTTASGCTYSGGTAVTATPYRYATATPYRAPTSTPYRYVTPTPYYRPTATPAARRPVVSISYPNYPTTITQGNTFSIRGTVYTDAGTITEVKGEIINNYNYAVKSGYAYPNAQTYTLGGSSEINNALKFGQLSPGTYTYRITATAKNGSYTTQEVLVNQSFTVKSAATATPVRTPSLSISSSNYPTNLYVGDTFSIRGTIYTDIGSITEVKGEIISSYGYAVQRGTANPNTQSYSLANSTVNSNLRFGNLSAGTYTYRITATAKNGSQTSTKVLVERTFNVNSRATATPIRTPSLSISSPNYPTSLYEGDSFSVSGTVYTDIGSITEVKGEIISSYGYAIQRGTANPYTQSYSLRNSTVNSNLRFGQLTPGTYTYRVTATAANGSQTSTKVLVERTFTVISRATPTRVPTATPARTPNLSISSPNYPSSLYEGDTFNIRGTVYTDAGSLVEVRGEVIDYYYGYQVTGTSVYPYTQSYNLSNSAVNNALRFGNLSAGTYIYRITAYAQNGSAQAEKVLVDQTFTVRSRATATPARKPVVSITNATYPSTMYQGASFSIRGSVSTDCGVLTEVRGEVIDEWGYAQQSRTVYPNTASLDLRPSDINQKMAFGKLAPGNYTYRITATAQNGGYVTTEILIDCFFTVLEQVTPTPAPVTPAPVTPVPITPAPTAPATPTPEPTQAPTLPPPVPGQISVWQIDTNYSAAYGNLPENMVDDNPDTAYGWYYSKGADKVRFTLHVTDGDISYFLIRNGYPSDSKYFNYCRVYKISLDFYCNGEFMGTEEDLMVNGDGHQNDYEVVPLSRTYSGATEIQMRFSAIKRGKGDNEYLAYITDIMFQ